MVSKCILSLFGSMASTIVGEIAKAAFGSKGDGLLDRVELAVSASTRSFFEIHGKKYGKESHSFLARKSNWIVVARSLKYNAAPLHTSQLDPRGFDSAPDADDDGLRSFIEVVTDSFSNDMFLNLMLGVKESIHVSRETEKRLSEGLQEIIERLSDSTEATPSSPVRHEITHPDGERRTEFEEGRLYKVNIRDGVKLTYMRRGNRMYVEAFMGDGATAYLEVDEKAKFTMRKPPYPLSIFIPPEYIVGHEIISGDGKNRSLVIHGKWGLRVECEIDPSGRLSNPTVIKGHITIRSKDQRTIITPQGVFYEPDEDV